jgi:hypothetical protein
MKQKTIRICSVVAKAASVLTGAAAYASLLPPAWAGAAVIVFGAVYIAKDAAISAGDLADDGQRNGSFRP